MKQFLLVFILILGVAFYFTQHTLQGRLFLWGVNMDLSGFTQTSFVMEKTRAVKEEKLEVKKGETTIRITKTTVENNQKLIDDRIYLLESLFVPTTSPYPEALSNNITCPEEFRPKDLPAGRQEKSGKIFTLFAGERLNFGVCSEDLVKYKAVYGIFDCKEKGVFEVRGFGQNTQELKAIMTSFSCE